MFGKIDHKQNITFKLFILIFLSCIFMNLLQFDAKAASLSLYGNATSLNRILLYWNNTAEGNQYTIERKFVGGGYAIIATVQHGTTSWTDTSLVPNAQYTYRIKVTNSENESFYSNEVTISNSFLEAPSGLMLNVNSDMAQELVWTDNSIDEQGFEIWRYSYNTHGSSGFNLYAVVGRNVTSFIDINAQLGIQYSYMVRAYDAERNIYSAFSNSVIGGTGIITPPDRLSLSSVSDTQVTLTWRDNSSNEHGFKVERKVGLNGEWAEIAALPANTTTYTSLRLVPYTQYFYRIRAYNYSYSSNSFSNELEVNIGKPHAPQGLTLETLSSTQINLSWVDVSSNEQGFKVERRKGGESRYRVIATLEPDVEKYADKGLNPGTRYYYRVIAFNRSGSVNSNLADTTTKEKVTFEDLNSAQWAKGAIEDLSSRGIIKGKTSKLFRPHDKMTRAEFTSLIIRAFKLEMPAVGSLADVKYGKWYYSDVMAAKNLGIISGDDKEYFYPDRYITREDIAVIITKTLRVVEKPLAGFDNSTLEKFIDKNMISPYAISSMASLYGEGILSGRTSTTIAPKDIATRAEAALLLYKIIDR